ncbi:MAG TPA: hypothetical protein VMJ12_14125 [Candidatus Acidoferrales bacterium]|nr:hypothetical protein [Candidatus Acidoferrales bacterium]
MNHNTSILRIGLTSPFTTVMIICSAVLLSGCSTVVTYQPNLPPGPERKPGYPIPVYTQDKTVPRPCELIGTVSISGGYFTMRGGSAEEETERIIKIAWKKGADVARVKLVQDPGFTSASYSMEAQLLRYADTWETIPISMQSFTNYLDSHQKKLDPIEGIWEATGTNPHRIGIIRDRFQPGRDFVGFIINTTDPTWHKGYKKIDIQRGPQPGGYILDYYLEDFSKAETTVLLGQSSRFRLNMPTTDEDADIITYTRESP